MKLPESYPTLLENIKARIRESQVKAAVAVNQELIRLHWWIGSEIVRRQEIEGWKAEVIDRLCKDIQADFPGLKGFSRSNVFYMRLFYISYARVQQAVGFLEIPPDYCLSIPWGHNVVLLNKLKDLVEREWYARRAVEYGCSRAVLEMWIETSLYHRQGKAPNNFHKALPAPHSDLAKQTIKDPYCFDFLTLIDEAREKEIEDGLMDHLQKFLLELGSGFAFVGRQVPLRVGNEDYYLDLLFYHIKLRCYFLIELKAVKFKPDFAGQINFYLAAIDDKMRQPGDNPTIGLILCKGKDNLVVEYALRNNMSPISVANFETQLAKALPDNLKTTLPSVEEIEAALEKTLHHIVEDDHKTKTTTSQYPRDPAGSGHDLHDRTNDQCGSARSCHRPP
ncbi:MAG: PDDEXK nuclease domain-containing protein [Parachlamydia sp.]|nr:PDDEXK nuclease domain-containing protein [Parachlamydia sp.]